MKKAFIIILLFYSCKKENPEEKYYCFGRITDQYYGIPVAGAKITIYTTDNISSSRYQTFKQIVAETITDDSGYYNITYKAFKKDSKGLRIQKEGYYNSPELRLIEQGEVNKMIAPNKNVQIHIKNEVPFDDNDSIYVYIETPNYMQFGLKGKNIDTSLLLSFVYDFSQKIAWRIVKNGDTAGYITSLNCAPLDTCFYKIYY